MKDDYLFDPNAASEVDAEVRDLEQALAPFSHEARGLGLGELDESGAPTGQTDRFDENPARSRPGGATILAAALIVALIGGALWFLPGESQTKSLYSVASLSGQPTVNGERTSLDAGHLGAGQRIVCDASSQLELRVGSIGSITLEPGTSLRLEAPENPDAEFQLYLEGGELRAVITAAPRLFQVGTPAGLAVDLGCVYRARVEEDGSTQLNVDVGQVAFEAMGRRVVVPAGAGIRAELGERPSTPLWDDSGPSLRDAVARIDESADTASSHDLDRDLAQILALETSDATLLLWNLMGHHNAFVREACGERLSELSPPPKGVELIACLRGDADQLEQWKHSLGWSW